MRCAYRTTDDRACTLGLFGGRPHRGVCRVSCPIPADQRTWTVIEGGDLLASGPGPCPPGFIRDPRIQHRYYRDPAARAAQAKAPAARRTGCKSCRGL